MDGFPLMAKKCLVALLGSGGTLGNGHCTIAHEDDLGARAQHEAAESVGGFAVGGKTDIEGLLTRCAEGGGRVDQIDLFLGDVGHEYFGTVPRNGQVLTSSGDGDIRQVGDRSVAEGVDVAQIDALGVAIDGCESSKLLNECVLAGHAAERCREQEGQLLFGELASDVQDFPEEAALRHLTGGLRVLDGLGKATHVGDAVPAGTDDRANLTFESTQDSLLNFTHSFKYFKCE